MSDGNMMVPGPVEDHIHCLVLVSLSMCGDGAEEDPVHLAGHVVHGVLEQAVKQQLIPSDLLYVAVGPAKLVAEQEKRVSGSGGLDVEHAYGVAHSDQVHAKMRDRPDRLSAVAWAHCVPVDRLPEDIRDRFRDLPR